MTKVNDQQRAESLKMLRKLLKPGDTVQCVLRQVSSSGMTRRIDFYKCKDGEMLYLTGYIANILGMRRHPSKDGLVVQGCGMDMGFHVVYSLGHVLFPKGFKVKKNTLHRNGTENGQTDPEGGYALWHRWI